MNFTRVAELALTSLFSIAITLGIVIYSQPQGLPTGIVTLDATEAVLSFIQAGARDLADADYETEALKYQAELEAAIARFAEANDVIVVNSAVVLAGAPDVTDYVTREAMQQ